MFTASNIYTTTDMPIVATVPKESGVFPLKSFAFVTALMVCSSASAQGATVGTMRLDSASNGLSVVARQQEADLSIADAISEIRRRSGVTWSQLASILKVSRQAVHSWATGAAVRSGNAASVFELYETVRALSDLPVFKVKDALLGRTSANVREPSGALAAPPILISDNRPFEHQLELKPGKTRIKRG